MKIGNEIYHLIRADIKSEVEKFKTYSKPGDRYTSFDYCYNYFLATNDLTKDIEKSCLALGFYLASWGMLRGSSFLLQKSAKHLEPTVRYISKLDRSVWKIDVNNYSDQNIHTILTIYKDVKECLIPNGSADLALTTKVLLGVFGFLPAFDNYFCNTFRIIADGECGFRRVNEKSLTFIRKFYEANMKTVDNLAKQTFTTDFMTGKKTKINYPKAKIIDMYGFTMRQ